MTERDKQFEADVEQEVTRLLDFIKHPSDFYSWSSDEKAEWRRGARAYVHKRILESRADEILRENGFNTSGSPRFGKVCEERRRGAAIRLGHNPYYFEEYTDSPRDD